MIERLPHVGQSKKERAWSNVAAAGLSRILSYLETVYRPVDTILSFQRKMDVF